VGKYEGKLVAIKKQERETEKPEKYLLQELSVLSKLKSIQHENIIAYYGAHNEHTNPNKHVLYIVLEYCQNGDLFELLTNNSIQIGWKFRINLAKQAVAAIVYMHQHNILHRDVKSAVYLNFLLVFEIEFM